VLLPGPAMDYILPFKILDSLLIASGIDLTGILGDTWKLEDPEGLVRER